MTRRISTTAFFVLLLFVLTTEVEGRHLKHRISDNDLVSDGVDDDVQLNKTSCILLRGIEFESDSEEREEECKHMYGFLPCSSNMLGHAFLIMVYEYLLFQGESYLNDGGEQIFKILGPGIFGASAFHVLSALPESLIFLVSGVVSSKEIAEEYAYTGVGLLAGSSIFLLTLVWGTCVVTAALPFSNDSALTTSNASTSSLTKLKAFLTGCGIKTDLETSYTARIMVLSVIPLIIMQIPSLLHFSSASTSVTLIIALTITVLFLFFYFTYQIFEPWIQKRRLEYVKHDRLLVKLLQHVKTNTLKRILTKQGSPNVSAIRRLYREIDQDGDSVVSASEVKEMLLKSKSSNEKNINEKEIEELLRIFKVNGDDNRITKDEFVSGFIKWLEQTKLALNKQYMSRKSLKEIYQVFQPWIQNKREEQEIKKLLISEILRHVQSGKVGSLLTEDGTPDEFAIRRLFEQIDSDRDNCISPSELRELLKNINSVKASMDVEEAVSKVIEELDLNSDHVISEEEFVSGFQNWLSSSSSSPALLSDFKSEEDIFQMWEDAEMVMEEKESKALVDKPIWAWSKAIVYVLVGIAILSVLAEPLTESVQKFSNSAGVNAFFISFILVPLATNAREATSAIKESSHKKPRTTSLTFSEIYGGVFMNNVLGFFAISVLIYVREMTWQFSAEVLVVAIVCAAMGVTAGFRSTFPLWSSFCAYLLYPLSLVLVFYLNNVLNYV